MKVQPGQIYDPVIRDADAPRTGGSTAVHPVVVTQLVYPPIPRSAQVTRLDGKYPRTIAIEQFHDSPLTSQGKPRRYGYVLRTESAA